MTLIPHTLNQQWQDARLCTHLHRKHRYAADGNNRVLSFEQLITEELESRLTNLLIRPRLCLSARTQMKAFLNHLKLKAFFRQLLAWIRVVMVGTISLCCFYLLSCSYSTGPNHFRNTTFKMYSCIQGWNSHQTFPCIIHHNPWKNKVYSIQSLT